MYPFFSRYIDPTSDYGFKKIFAEEANKDLTMSLIQDLLELEKPLVDLTIASPEQLPFAKDLHGGVYDLFCRASDGTRYLIEMQKSRIQWMRDRMMFYSTFPIIEDSRKSSGFAWDWGTIPEVSAVREAIATYETTRKAKRPVWNFKLHTVYCIAIARFAFSGSRQVVSTYTMRRNELPHDIFYDKLIMVTVELPLFDENKPEYSLDRHRNKWLYFLQNAFDWDDVPPVLADDKILRKALAVAEFANLKADEKMIYLRNLMAHYTAEDVMRTRLDEALSTGLSKGFEQGFDQGKNQGIEQGQAEGMSKGKLEGKIEDLMMLSSSRFGAVPQEIENEIRALKKVEQLNKILTEFYKVDGWEGLRNLLTTV